MNTNSEKVFSVSEFQQKYLKSKSDKQQNVWNKKSAKLQKNKMTILGQLCNRKANNL